MGGLDINLMIAIDFTGSNGDPRSPDSLHYLGPPTYESDYLRVIKSVARILESYDKDGMIPVYGFGANISPPRKQISHCFPLTFGDDPEVRGVDGVIQAYTQALRRIQLYGPTNFGEVLQTARVMSCHDQSAKHLHWTLLLIITDGKIDDIDRTISEIVTASHVSALSIIIVGVGKGHPTKGFKPMEILDADDEPLVATKGEFRGKQMKADIVQFVEFDKHKEHIGQLAKEVLMEVPEQVEDYMSRNGHVPGRPMIARGDTMTDLYDGPSGLAASGIHPTVPTVVPATGMAAPIVDAPVAAAYAALMGVMGGYPMAGGVSMVSGGAAPAMGATGAMATPPTLTRGTSHAHLPFNPYYQTK